jgi:hypothetical protein
MNACAPVLTYRGPPNPVQSSETPIYQAVEFIYCEQYCPSGPQGFRLALVGGASGGPAHDLNVAQLLSFVVIFINTVIQLVTGSRCNYYGVYCRRVDSVL